MAEAILEVVLQNLRSVIQNELGLFLGVNHEVKRLSSTLSTILAVLQDAEEKQFTDKSIKNWLQKLKDAAHMLDDLLDEYATKGLQSQYDRQKCRSANKVQNSCLSTFHIKNILLHHKTAKKMKEMRVKLDEIAEERKKFHLCEAAVERRTEVMEWRQTTSIISQPQVYGREEDKKKIIDYLVGHASNIHHVVVYPITGIGGIGKTTLAQLVFNDEKVIKHFQLKIWVCVSENFSMKRVLKAVIESTLGYSFESLDLDPLQRKLQETLQNKRYLIVLDDVWNDDQEKWERLKYALACGSRGSSILVTSRLAKVASIMGTLPSHHLSGLSIDDCWELFKQRAFGLESEERAELVDIGKEIVKKCSGVPLAAKTLGSLLRFKREESEWLNIKESKLWNLPQDENSILSALRLSYLNLPFKLRHCFAYCAMFPKGKEINKHLLIQLWMANGFISSNERSDLEDVGNEVWNELCLRSFFQDIKTNEFGMVTSFKIHDLVHDLAQAVMEDECRTIDNVNSESLSENIRHLFVAVFRMKRHNFGLSCVPKSLRSSLHASNAVSSVSLLFRSTSLRALHESGSERITELPSSIGNLKHLRYLNLSSTQIKLLPGSICSLWNLQVLILSDCWNLIKLPKGINCLKGLRELRLDGCSSLTGMPPNVGQLTSLRILTRYIVGNGRGFQINELGCLNLKGNLTIDHLERVKGLKEAKESNLVHKNLTELSLSWHTNVKADLQANVEQILDALEPHAKLSSLYMEGYKGAHLAQWMGSRNLKNLSSISLVDCENCIQLPSLGKLPSLKYLRISGMQLLQYIHDESCSGGTVKAFQSLENLEVSYLVNLKSFFKYEVEEIFPCLSSLSISRCPKLALPSLPSVKDLVLIDCSELSLSSISNLSCLRFLQISVFEELITLPQGMLRGLSALEELHITYFSKLESLPEQMFDSMHSLRTIKIDSCEQLKSLWEGFEDLVSLETLEIIRCPELVGLPNGIIYLRSLRRLIISFHHHIDASKNTPNPAKLAVLPDAMGHISSLQYLKISGSQNLESLPELGNLVSLQTLEVGYFPRLTAIPPSIHLLSKLRELKLRNLQSLVSLPDRLEDLTSLETLHVQDCPKLASLPMSFQRLTNLKTLAIVDCPELQKSCRKGIGEEWHKIAHIPCVKFVPQDSSP